MTGTHLMVALTPLMLLIAMIALYPVMLVAVVRIRRDQARGHRNTLEPPQPVASASVLVTCHNEAAELHGALDALLNQEGLRIPLQLVVASDASTDATSTIAAEYAARGVTLFEVVPRAGKTGTENKARNLLTGDVIFCMDAASRPSPGCLALMLEAFGDHAVGVVSSRDTTAAPAAFPTSAEATYVYWEMWLRDLESQAGGTVGVSGSLYAMRRQLFVPLASDTARDFASVLLAHAEGFVALTTPATCHVRPASSLRSERRRRNRTMTQGMTTLLRYQHLVRFRDGPGFALKLVMHKMARWLLIPAAALAVLALMATAASRPGGAALLAAALAGVGLAIVIESRLTRRSQRMGPWLGPAAASCVAGLQSWYQMMLGKHTVKWEPTRRR